MAETIIQLHLNAQTDGVEEALSRTKEQIDKAKQAADEASETLGVKIPSAIKDLLAESEMIGPVLEAAFAPLMILSAIQAIAEIVAKIVELGHKSEEQRQANIALESSFQDTSAKITQEIDKQQEKYIELTKGPIAAMEYGLKHMANEAIKAFQDLEGELDKVSENLESQKKWYDLFDFQNFKDASKEIKTFKADLDKAMHDAAAANPGDPMAGFRQGMDLTDKKIKEVRDNLATLEQDVKDGKKFSYLLAAPRAMLADLEKFKAQLEQSQKKGEATVKTETAKVDHSKSEKDAGLKIADINANKQIADALIKQQEEVIKSLHARKLISDEDEMNAAKALINRKIDQDKGFLQQKLDQLKRHSVENAAEIKAVTAEMTMLETQRKTELLKIDDQYYAEEKKQEDAAMKKAADNLKAMIKKIRDAKTEQMQEVADHDKLEVKLEEQTVEQKFDGYVTIAATYNGVAPAMMSVFFINLISNNTGAAFTTGANLYADARVDDLYCVPQWAMTGNEVGNTGNKSVTYAGTMAYTSTSSSITWTWTNLAALRTDLAMSSNSYTGSQAITGLAASTSYNFYPFIDEIFSQVNMVATGGTGTPSWAHVGVSAAWTQEMTRADHYPLSTTPFAATTAAVGGSGGGSTPPPDGSCLRHDVKVRERSRGLITVSQLEAGDWVSCPADDDTPDGWVQVEEIQKGYTSSQWVHSHFNNHDWIATTTRHPFTLADGSVRDAFSLTFEDQVPCTTGIAFMKKHSLEEYVALKVDIKVASEAHVFYAGMVDASICQHNLNSINIS